MGYRTKALVLALFFLLAVSTLLTTSANVVAKEEGHLVVDAKKGLKKVLNEKTVESVGKATNVQDIPSLEDEKYYGYSRGGYGRRGYGHGGYGRRGYGQGRYGRGQYGQGRGGYSRGRGGYGRGRNCRHC